MCISLTHIRAVYSMSEDGVARIQVMTMKSDWISES